MRPLNPRLRALARRLSGRTIRSRLTLVYGSLFLVSGAVLLVITGVLWGRATREPITISAKFPSAIAQIVRPPGGGFNIQGPNFSRAPRSALLPSQLRQVGAQLRLVAGQQQGSDLHKLLFYSAIALGIMTLIAIGLGFVIAGRVLRPLRTITSSAQEISASNLHERLEMHGPDDELKKLGDTIDELLGRLEHSFEAQRLFVANASHELRTPLTTMRASIDVALAKPGAIPAPMQRLADGLSEELDHVDELLESFLVLAQAQRVPTGESALVSLDALCDSALAVRAGAVAALGLQVRVEECAEATVLGNETLLARLVENLIENAVRHNVNGGYVHVRSEVHGEWARLVVENGGATFDGEDTSDLLQPFRRRGTARTGSANGFGLGLSIVAAIVDTHGGQVELRPIEGGGLQIIVELPLANLELIGAIP
jgi:signal transduction histidine kinase